MCIYTYIYIYILCIYIYILYSHGRGSREHFSPRTTCFAQSGLCASTLVEWSLSNLRSHACFREAAYANAADTFPANKSQGGSCEVRPCFGISG